MAEQEDGLCRAPEETSPGVTLSDSLVLTHTQFKGPLPTSTIRLDRENISCIEKLRRLEEIHSIYLQQNQIEKIENLESFPNLRFLCLAGNRIQRVENLKVLPHLSALDLSHNLIRVLDTEELPRSLRILDLTGNECTLQDGYRDVVVAALPHLLQLDSQPIHGNTAQKDVGGGSFSSEEEDEDEDDDLLPALRIPFTVDKDFLMDMHQELAGRAQWRRRQRLQEHQAWLQELLEHRAQDGAATARHCWLWPQGTPGAQLSPLPASCGSQPAPGASPGKALGKETRAKGAGNGQLAQTSRSSRE